MKTLSALLRNVLRSITFFKPIKGKIMKFRLFTITLLAVLLTGCDSQGSKKIVSLNLKFIPVSKTADSNLYTQNALADAANAINKSMNQLAAIEIATHHKGSMSRPYNPRAVGMSQIVSVDWTGPMLPFVRKIARASGYHVRVLGVTPPIPPIVNVNMKNQPLAYVLRNVQYQAHRSTTIRLYPRVHTIEVRYIYNR